MQRKHRSCIWSGIDIFTHCLMQLWGTWNALTCSYKWINNFLIHKMLNTDIWNYKKKKNFKCEIKTASRWHQVTVNKRVIAIEPNHLNSWFIHERNTFMLLRDAKQCCVCVWNYFCWRNRAKTGSLKRKSLNINFLFIELLYKITFIIMLIFGAKNGARSSCDIV